MPLRLYGSHGMLIRRYGLPVAVGLAAGLALVLALSPRAEAVESQPIVVELYTSQGCSTCPPADAYLGELVRREDVIALSFHVNYWDYIGWKDPFASAESTGRQRAYARALRQSYVYTPQMIIDGRVHEVGTKRAAVERRLDGLRAGQKSKLAVRFSRNDEGGLSVTIPSANRHQRAAVWMALFDRSHTTEIKRGENRGRTLTYYNVVRRISRIGTWEGAEITIPISLPAAEMGARDGCVVIVQSESLGPILGAALMPLNPR